MMLAIEAGGEWWASLVWHVADLLGFGICACVHAYIHLHAHVQCSYWERLWVAESQPGSIGSGGTAHSTLVKLRGECERDVVLGRCGWERFLGID